MSKHELIAKIRTIKELQSLIEEATQEIEALKDELKAHMTEQGTQELNVDIFKLRYTKITSTRFDSAAFKKLTVNCTHCIQNHQKHCILPYKTKRMCKYAVIVVNWNTYCS